MKKLLGFITGLSAFIAGYVFWIVFIFSKGFAAKNSYEPQANIGKYSTEGGRLHLALLLSLITIQAILFVFYIYKDHKAVELYNDQFEIPEFIQKDNLFTVKRVLQVSLLAFAIVRIATIIVRTYTYNPDADFFNLYSNGYIVIFGFEILMFYYLFLTGSLLLEISEARYRYEFY